MITATKNGKTRQFTEAFWDLMPDDKYGWAPKKADPPAEVTASIAEKTAAAQAAKAEKTAAA